MSRKLRRAAVIWFGWKVPPWAGALAGRQSHPVGPTHTLRGWGHIPGPTEGTSRVNTHNSMFAQFYRHTEHDLMQEWSPGFGWHLLHKDPWASLRCCWPFPACSLLFSPAEQRGAEIAALLPAYRHTTLCKAVSPFVDRPFTASFLPSRKAPGM